MMETHVTYLLLIEEPEQIAAQWDDEKPEPLVYGCIDLIAEGKQLLEKRLTALAADDLIGEWSMAPYDPPKLITEHQVLLAITDDLEDVAAQEVAQVWHNVAAETT